jgi:hypothetical protein
MITNPVRALVEPAATPEQAAAISAAITQFQRDTAASADAAAPAPTPWQRAALHEGVERASAWG